MATKRELISFREDKCLFQALAESLIKVATTCVRCLDYDLIVIPLNTTTLSRSNQLAQSLQVVLTSLLFLESLVWTRNCTWQKWSKLSLGTTQDHPGWGWNLDTCEKRSSLKVDSYLFIHFILLFQSQVLIEIEGFNLFWGLVFCIKLWFCL